MLHGMASLDNSSSRILGTGAVPEDGIVEGVATSLQGGGSWASQAEPPQSIVASTGSPINPECSQKTSLYARICSQSIMRKANNYVDAFDRLIEAGFIIVTPPAAAGTEETTS